MQYRLTTILAATLAVGVSAAPSPQFTPPPTRSLNDYSNYSPNQLGRRAQPAAARTSVLKAAQTIAAGQSFDGGLVSFDRGVSCTGQAEGGDSDAVFILEAGASLSNVIIGPNQIEGVHCRGGCTLTNVWWSAVCEDAFTIKVQADGETTTIQGGGATGAEDKVIQHNGGGKVVINDFTVSNFGKLYRSCGNCKSMPARHVEISGGSATDGKMLVGINPNMGDTAKISGMSISGVKEECVTFKGVTDGSEPEKVGTCDGNSGGSGSNTTASGGAATTKTAAATTKKAETTSTAVSGEGEDSPATTTKAAKASKTKEAKASKTKKAKTSKAAKTKAAVKATATPSAGAEGPSTLATSTKKSNATKTKDSSEATANPGDSGDSDGVNDDDTEEMEKDEEQNEDSE